MPLVAGLDMRFGWTAALGDALHIAGAVLLVFGLEFASWAMIVNAYFSTSATIQKERKQTVCKTGPYKFVRHPGYVGYALQSLGTPLLLGSLWALVPGIFAAAMLVIRTYLEDRMLQDELSGYKQYTKEVRYRLVPGIW